MYISLYICFCQIIWLLLTYFSLLFFTPLIIIIWSTYILFFPLFVYIFRLLFGCFGLFLWGTHAHTQVHSNTFTQTKRSTAWWGVHGCSTCPERVIIHALLHFSFLYCFFISFHVLRLCFTIFLAAFYLKSKKKKSYYTRAHTHTHKLADFLTPDLFFFFFFSQQGDRV